MSDDGSGIGAPRLVQAVRAHTGEVACLDAVGGWLATGGGSVLRLWQWKAGSGWGMTAEARAAHRYGVTCVRWNKNGVLLASCGVDGALRVWCGRRLVARRLLAAGGATAARALAWGGARLAAGHDDGVVCVWAPRAAALLARLAPADGAVHALCTPARDALLLVGCTHGVVKVFDLEEICAGGLEQGEGPAPLLVERGAHDLGALCAAASEDGAACATGGHDACVRLWRATRRRLEPTEKLEGHSAAVTALRWARGLLASASLDRTARLWAPPACLHVVLAHPRYLTCLALALDLSVLITGSNDKSFRTWALRGLELQHELEPPCDGMPHFALGDLQGINPLDDDELLELDAVPEEEDERGEHAGGARLAWSGRPHSGAVNCVSACGNLLATASSDGLVKVFRCEHGALAELHALEAHQYPAQAAAWGAGGLLLSAGLDGQAVLWDAESGCRLRALSVPASAGAGDAGGGGVRGAGVSPHRPPLLMLATDDGLAPVWSLAEEDPMPIHVYGAGEATGAAWCCGWTPDGRGAALGDAGGALRLLAPPLYAVPRQIAIVGDAHDFGVTSCLFAPSAEATGYGAGEGGPGGAARHVLATAGGDSLIKLWIVDIDEEAEGSGARIQLARRLEAHGGAAASAAWGAGRAGGMLASAGDEWARAWLAAAGACVAAAPAGRADTGGYVALWRLSAELAGEGGEEEAAQDARCWGPAGVRQWMLEFVTRVPGRLMETEEETELLGAARGAALTGARLLDDPLPELMRACGYEEAESDKEESAELALESEGEEEAPRARLRRELRWLRRAPPGPGAEDSAPHALRCPLSHRLLAAPARAADGLTYERAGAHDWFLAAEGAVSAVSGRRLRSARLVPNYGVRRNLRRFLRAALADELDQPDQSDQREPSDQPDQSDQPDKIDELHDADTADLLGLDD